MRIFLKITFVLVFFLFSTNLYSFEIIGDKVNLSGKITSITLKEGKGIINVVSDNEKYGKTWLTYNLKLSNPNSPDQGSFYGRATAINKDGSRASASRQGVWSREGSIYSFLSLDDVSDGNQYLCITEMDVNTDQVEMRFYAK
tara:strand:+ start:260 stop:688 length:429 start_codon:yes stop_codon:yes gene_type:complete